MDETPATRMSLLARLNDPLDEQAWQEFADIYEPLIQRLLRRKGLQEADVRDMTQEVFQAVVGAIERKMFDPSLGSFRAWLFRIAHNLMVNYLVSQRHHPRGTGDTGMQALLEAQPAEAGEDSALFETEYQCQLLAWAAEQVRHEFTDLSWQAFWQTAVDGRAAKDVADALGTTVGVVYSFKSRIMARLRQKIGQVQGEA
jgi:RNA polymerase sigma-70 factor (ECF subfamily)